MSVSKTTTTTSEPEPFWRSQRAGLAIQAAMLVLMVVQNLIVPRLLGPALYAMVVVLVSGPNLVTGLAEPLFSSLLIRWRLGADPRVAYVLRIALISVVCAGVAAFVLTCLYGLRYARIANIELDATTVILLLAYTVLVSVNPIFLGLSFARKSTRRIPVVYLGSAIVSAVCMVLVIRYGLPGAMALFVAVQFITLIILSSGRGRTDVRDLMAHLRRTPAMARGSVSSVSRVMFSAVAPRLMVTLVSIVAVLLASLYMRPLGLAVFRVGVTLLNAAQYAVPVSAPLLQAYFSRGQHKASRAAALQLGAAIGAIGLAGAAIAMLACPTIMPVILGRGTKPDFGTYVLLASIPAYILVGPLSAVLFSTGRERIVIRSLAIALIAFVIVFFGGGVQWAIFAATGVFSVQTFSELARPTREKAD